MHRKATVASMGPNPKKPTLYTVYKNDRFFGKDILGQGLTEEFAWVDAANNLRSEGK
jgi:hypothetical protein